MLIEEYKIDANQTRENPAQALVTKVVSNQLFNLNLTYGCILSLYKVLQFLRDDEKETEEDPEKEEIVHS